MKILFYTVIDINGSYGSGLHQRKIADKLKSFGHDVILFAPKHRGEKKTFSFSVVYLSPEGNNKIATKFLQDIMGMIKLVNLLVHLWKPDIVYSRFGLSTIFLPIFCKLFNIHYMTELNGSYKADFEYRKIPKYFIPFLLSIEKLNYLCSSRVITVSDELAQLLKMQGVDKKKIITVLNGVEVDDYKIQIQSDDSFRKMVRKDAALVFGFLGRFEKWHGLVNVIEALALIKTRKPLIAKKIRTIFIGVGTEQKSLENLTDERGLRDMLQFTGWVDHQIIPQYLDCIDIALAPYLPYLKEIGNLYSCPLKILDYLAARKWIIASDTLFTDVILENQAGLILKKVDPEEIYHAMIWAWENQTQIAENNKISIEYMERNYSWTKTAQELESLMNDCLSNS